MAERILMGTMVLAMLFALFVGGAQPAAAGMIAAPWDKLAHLGYFLVLAILLRHVLPGRWWPSLAIALLIGASDELHQLMLPGREPSFADWLADLCGAGIGLALHRACKAEYRSTDIGVP